MKDIINSEFNMKLLGGVVICALLTIYLYYFGQPLDTTIKMVDVQLIDRPNKASRGGDIQYHYYILESINNEQYYLDDCSFKASKIEKLSTLTKGDYVQLGVLAEGSNNIVSLTSAKTGPVLDFRDYLTCEKNGWKYTFYLGIAMIVFFIVRTLISFVKKKK